MQPKYRLEELEKVANYQRWIQVNETKPLIYKHFSYSPKFSVIIPVYNAETYQLEECIQSVLAQSYTNYELILVDDCSTWDNVRPVLQRYEKQDRVKVIYRPVNGQISQATNDGIKIADGDFVVFVDCDDTISKDALYWFAEKLNVNKELDFIYSDEDKLTEDSKIRHFPFFKPEWSPDLYMSMNYTSHLSAYRSSLVKKLGGLRTAYNGSQDYDLTLRLLEISNNKRVGHIPKILYHWRERKESVAFSLGAKNYVYEAARKAKEDALKRRNIAGRIEDIEEIAQHHVVYDVQGNPLVSIIIPSKDNPEMLKQCIKAVQRRTNYKNYEIIVVDNGSSEENKSKINTFLQQNDCIYLYEQHEFNFSYMCNWGASFAKGEYLLFLNDDVEVFMPGWLSRMLGQAQQAHTGAVGVKLYYPDTTIIQHDGVINIKNGPSHSFHKENDAVVYPFDRNRVDCNFLGVTGACLLVSKKKFNIVNGFNENLAVNYNDVDLCFKLYENGFYNVLRNDVSAFHHESFSRGVEKLSDSKLARLHKERETLYNMHPLFRGYDPFYSSVFVNNCSFLLRVAEDSSSIGDLTCSSCLNNENKSFLNKRVSIIIPCYNHGKYVREAIVSALDQTYENIEIVCVNDGSADNSSEIIGEMARKYRKRIVFIDNKQNRGVIHARNQAIEKCHGDYILPLDADDKIGKTYVELAVAVLDANPDIGVVYCKGCFFGSINDEWNLPEFKQENILIANFIPNSAMFRKRDFMSVGKYNNNMINGLEYWDLWLSFVEKGLKFYRLDEPLYYRRRYEEESRSALASVHYDELYKQIMLNHVQLYGDIVLLYYDRIRKTQQEFAQVKRELEATRNELGETRNELGETKNELTVVQQNLNAIQAGWSFRLGRAITYLPRKLLGRP